MKHLSFSKVDWRAIFVVLAYVVVLISVVTCIIWGFLNCKESFSIPISDSKKSICN